MLKSELSVVASPSSAKSQWSQFKSSKPSALRNVTTDLSALNEGLIPDGEVVVAFLDFDGTIVREPATSREAAHDLRSGQWTKLVSEARLRGIQLIPSTGRSCSEAHKIGQVLNKEVKPPYCVICENGGAAVVCRKDGSTITVVLDESFQARKQEFLELAESSHKRLLHSDLIAQGKVAKRFTECCRELSAHPNALRAAAHRQSSMFFIRPENREFLKEIGSQFGFWYTDDDRLPHVWGSQAKKEEAAKTVARILNGRLKDTVAAGNSWSNDLGQLQYVNSTGGTSFFVGDKNPCPEGSIPLSSHADLPEALRALFNKY